MPGSWPPSGWYCGTPEAQETVLVIDRVRWTRTLATWIPTLAKWSIYGYFYDPEDVAIWRPLPPIPKKELAPSQ